MTPQMSIAITGKNMTAPAFAAVVGDAQKAAANVNTSGAQMAAAMGGASFQTANLAAQFNDIGVMLAAGQSPLLLAAQQGTQIAQVFSGMKAGEAVAALKTALLSLVNPVTLVTIGSIAAGAAAVQWLMNAHDDAETATEAFERHRTAIGHIVDGYGAAETAVDAYFEAVGRLPRDIVIGQVNDQFAAIGSEVEAFRDRMADFASDPLFAKFGSEANLAMQDLAGSFAKGELSAEDFYQELEEVKGQLNLLERAGAAIPGSTQAMIDAWQEGAIKAMQFGNAINNLVAQSHTLAGLAVDGGLASFFEENSVEGALEALQSLTPELRSQQQIIQDTYAAALSNPALTDEGRSQLEVAREAAIAAVETAAGRREAASAAQSQADAYARVIENLEYEAEIMGVSAREQEVLNNIRAAGVEIGSREADEIRARTELIYDQNVALSEAERAQEALNDMWADYGRIGQTATRGIIDAFSDLKLEASEVGSILGQIGSSFLNMGLNTLFGGFGPGGGGPLSFLFGGGRASGGPVDAGTAYLVGEQGPEFIVPKESGYVIPAAQTAQMRGADQGGSGSLTLNLSGLGLSLEQVNSLISDAIDRFKRHELPGRVQAINDDPLARG